MNNSRVYAITLPAVFVVIVNENHHAVSAFLVKPVFFVDNKQELKLSALTGNC